MTDGDIYSPIERWSDGVIIALDQVRRINPHPISYLHYYLHSQFDDLKQQLELDDEMWVEVYEHVVYWIRTIEPNFSQREQDVLKQLVWFLEDNMKSNILFVKCDLDILLLLHPYHINMGEALPNALLGSHSQERHKLHIRILRYVLWQNPLHHAINDFIDAVEGYYYGWLRKTQVIGNRDLQRKIYSYIYDASWMSFVRARKRQAAGRIQRMVQRWRERRRRARERQAAGRIQRIVQRWRERRRRASKRAPHSTSTRPAKRSKKR